MGHVIKYVIGDAIDHVMRHVITGQSCNVHVIRHVILCNDTCNQLCNRDAIDHVMSHVITGHSCNVYVIRHVILCNGTHNQLCNKGCNGQCNEHVTWMWFNVIIHVIACVTGHVIQCVMLM